MTPADIAKSLNARKSGNGWTALCPAHKERTPSLPIFSARHATRVVNPAAHSRSHSPRTRCAHLNTQDKELT
jgi:hypothetical protein